MTNEEAFKLAMQACKETWNEKTCKQIKEVLEQQPCDDAVSRQAVINAIENDCMKGGLGSCFACYNDAQAFRGEIEKLPSVTQKYGKWILLDECANSGYYCSNCQKKLVKEGWSQTVKKINYCPNCGAKMVEPQERSGKV